MRDRELQEEVSVTLSRLWTRLSYVSDWAANLANLADVASAGECTGDYVSDLEMDLRDLVAVVGQYADTLDALRVRLDAESMGAPIA